MRAGTACGVAAAVTVLSPVTIGNGGVLAVLGGSLTVEGGVTVGSGAAFGDFNSAALITISDPLSIGDNAAVDIGLEQPGQPIISNVFGPVTAVNPSAVQIHNTLIAGPVSLTGGGAENPLLVAQLGHGFNFNDLEDNQILGPVSETGYAGIWSGIIRNSIFGGARSATTRTTTSLTSARTRSTGR